MSESRKITFNQNDINDVKERMRNLSDMNQELRMRNAELEKHLDDALKELYKYTIKNLEKEYKVELQPISSSNAQDILFTDAFEQLSYVKNNDLLYVNEKNRRFAYDNAEQFKWFIMKEKDGVIEEQKELQFVEVEAVEEEKESFKDIFHEVRIQDLPAYLKIFRYEENMNGADVKVISQSQWSAYERGDIEPSLKILKTLEDYCNIKVIEKAGVKSIRINNFGKRLEEVATKKGKKITHLAKETGIAYQTINNYKRNNQYPLAGRGILNKMANILDESICYLLTGTREWE